MSENSNLLIQDYTNLRRIGIFLPIAALAFLTAKLLNRNYLIEEEGGILEEGYNDEYSQHLNSNGNTGHIFVIDQGQWFDSSNVLNLYRSFMFVVQILRLVGCPSLKPFSNIYMYEQTIPIIFNDLCLF